MMSRVAYYLAAFAVIIALNMIFPVKGQPTLHGCGNEDSSNNLAAEQNGEEIRSLKEEVQSMRDLLTESFQQMKSRQASALRRLDVAIQLLLYHDISIKNHTGVSWKLEMGVPLPLEISIDVEDGFVLLPSINSWIVLMHRFDGSVNFNRNWTDYKSGFGAIGRGEFWLGNQIVHRLTTRTGVVYALRIEGQLDASGRWFYADYSTFSLDSEDNKYALYVSGFSGNAGDSLTTIHGNMSFSTHDNNNDRGVDRDYNCALRYDAGWWFNFCVKTCLTCPYTGNNFLWSTSNALQSGGKLRAARMMFKSA